MRILERVKRLDANTGVFAARLVLLFAALSLAGAGAAVALRDSPRQGAAERRYSCPMHPEVSATTSGQCPICKMALELVGEPRETRKTASAAHPPDCPMHAASAAAAATRGAQGKTPMVAPSREFAGGVTWLPETHPPADRGMPSGRPVLEAPRRRVFVDAVRAPARVETPERLSAVLYRDELVGLAPGERGRFLRASDPRVPIDVRLGDDAPAPWDASTSIVHFAVEAKADAHRAGEVGAVLREGDVGWLELERRPRELLVFPESALLRSSAGPYVLVREANGTFARRGLSIGRILEGHVVVLSGLGENEEIVVSRPFFYDTEPTSESRAGPLAEVRE